MSDLEIVKEFLVESYENLDRLDQGLITLEKDPTDQETLASIFRTIHTIKGTSGFLAFNKLGALTHVGENLLARLRDGQLTLNPEITTALLAMVDVVRRMLASIEADGAEGERDDSELIATLTGLLQPKAEANLAPAPAPDQEKDRQKRSPAERFAAARTQRGRHPHQAGRGQGQRSFRSPGAARFRRPAAPRRDPGGKGSRKAARCARCLERPAAIPRARRQRQHHPR